MAVIPVYRQRVQNPDRLGAPMQSINAPVEAFGGGAANTAAFVGEGLTKLAAGVEKAATKIQEREDNAWVNESMAKLHNLHDDYLFNESGGVFTRKGKAALGASTAAKADLNKFISDIESEAPNPNAAAAFKAQALTAYSNTLRSVARHEAQERQEYDVSAATAAAMAAKNSVERMYTNSPEEIEKQFNEEAAPKFAEIGRLRGADPTAQVAKARGEAYASIIARQLAEGKTEASATRSRELLTRWQGEMDADTATKLANAVRQREVVIKADKMAEDFTARLEKGESESSILSGIDAIEDVDLKKAARSAFKVEAHDYRLRKREAETDMRVSVTDGFLQRDGDLKAQFDYLQTFPEGSKQRKQAEALYAQSAKFQGLDRQTDPAAWAAIDRAMFPTDGGLPTITDERQLLSMPEYMAVSQAERDKFRKKLSASQHSVEKEIKDAYRRAHGGKPVGDKDEDYFNFRQFFDSRAADTNKAKDPKFVQEVADAWVLKGETPSVWGFGYGRNRALGEVLDDPKWLPLIREDADVRAGDTPDVTSLSKARAGEIRRVLDADPALKARLEELYGVKDDAAVRAYHKHDLIKRGVLPKGKK